VSYGDERDAEREIAEAAGVDSGTVIVDIPNRPRMKELGTNVVVDGMVRRLEDASELASSIRDAERARWRLGVYCPEEDIEPVGAAAREVLGLRGPQ
jgi:HD superfamily phosphohydrolase